MRPLWFGCSRRKDAVIDGAGLANEASPLKFRFRDKSDDVAHVFSSARMLGNASASGCDLYASGLESEMQDSGETR
ncbi:hypothetical protein AC629_34950 [Bradyrhizobium sp. NAS80.1]|nr:hypothetical protein AC629_34950 [Bradyrhizobium sp. NAS80.1]